jgi:hypothetical protein
MLTKGSINRQNTQLGKNCDAGSVAMGIDSSNRYHILKTNDIGELKIDLALTELTYQKNPNFANNSTFPVGLKSPDTLLAKTVFNKFPTNDIGLINFIPNLTLQSLTQPLVNLFIIPDYFASNGLYVYADGLPIGNVFAPDISLLTNNPLFYFRHAVPMQKISNTLNNYSLPLTSVQDKFSLIGGINYIFIATLDNSVNIINPNTQIQLSF